MKQTALILGGTGRFGRNMKVAFEAAGWDTVDFDRKRDSLDQKANGVDVIVHGWNPTYDRWERDVPILTKKVIGAAKSAGATVLIPGNVYVYGEGAPDNLVEDTPHLAQNPLGLIRRDMEAAFRNSGVRTIVMRGGDFLDVGATGNWFDQIIVKPLRKGKISYPGKVDVPHAWAYLPDFCRAFVMLAEQREALSHFASYNYAGYTLSGQEMAKLLGVRVTKMNWLPLYLAAPFWKLGRSLLEMRYLWNMPHRLDGHLLHETLPDFRQTPVNEALTKAASFKINPDKAVIGTTATV